MDAQTSIVVAVLAVAFVTALWSLTRGLSLFRQHAIIEGPWPLGSMMRRHGLSAEHAAGREYELTLAASRCAGCNRTDVCRRWLRDGHRSGANSFCPNAPFLAELGADAR
jgi:hypothetical protein